MKRKDKREKPETIIYSTLFRTRFIVQAPFVALIFVSKRFLDVSKAETI